MNIAYIVAVYPKKSESFVFREVQGMRQLGHEVNVFAVKTLEKDLDEYQMEIRKTIYVKKVEMLKEIIFRPINFFKILRKSYYLSKVATANYNSVFLCLRSLAIANAIRRAKAERIHAHWPLGSVLARLVHDITGIPISMSIHAHEAHHESGHFREVLPKCTFVSFCNNAVRKEMIRLYPSFQNKFILNYHGVDIGFFKPKKVEEKFEVLNIISVGRLTKTKGFDLLIKHCSCLYRLGYEFNLEIVGEGTELDALKCLTLELGISHNVTFHGWLSKSSLKHLLDEANIFALMAATNYHDGIPNVLLEAMAMQKVCIVSNLPAIKEVLNRSNGYIMKDRDDSFEFENIMLEIQKSSFSKTQSLRQSARSTVEKLMSHTTCLETFATNFESR